MKKTILYIIFGILCLNTIKSQTISYVSPKSDTLYLLNDKIGQTIAAVWNKPIYKKEKPIIVFTTDTNYLVSRRIAYKSLKKKSKN